jgi:hypothetical protein
MKNSTAETIRGFLVTVFIILLLAVSDARGEPVMEDESGIYLGLKMIGSSLHVDEEDQPFFEDDGGGIEFDFGYRFNPTFALELGLGGAKHETVETSIDAYFAMLHILGVYRFCPDRPFRPYLNGGFGGYSLRVEEDAASAEISGGGIVLGAGFRYFFSEHFAMGIDLTHNMIRYDEGKVSLGELSYQTAIDEEGAQTSFGLTFSYSF